jgi:hypothetical protein
MLDIAPSSTPQPPLRIGSSPQAEPSIDTLERELTTLAAHLNAGNYRFLKLLAEFEHRGGHAGWGIASCAHWLAWKCGISLIAAREKVRVARALEGLPILSEAMRKGVLSYCKVRALTRVATTENEDYLLYIAETGTVSHVEKTVRLYRRTERAQELRKANARHAERSLSYYFDDDGSLVIKGRLGPEQGALVIKALQVAGDALREAERGPESRESQTGPQRWNDSRESSTTPDAPREPVAARRADAFAVLAETFLARGTAPLAAGDRHLVTVHIDEQVLRDENEDGRCELEGGPALPPATVRRLCCDGSLVAIVHDSDGDPLNLGRKTRAVPPAMRRALDTRDGGCRFPGCTNARFVDAHHIHHWADGGETKLDNLVLLCRRHHRFVHEHGFRVEREDKRFRFVRPDGRPVPASPEVAPLDSDGWLLLTDAHAQLGLRVDHRTAVPTWSGESMDYNWAVGALQRRAELARSQHN